MTLGIIGTAGRGSDATRLTTAHWRMMCCIGQTMVAALRVDRVVSGGSAWADHVAVQLYLEAVAKLRLSLHLPAPFILKLDHVPEFDTRVPAGRRLNELHRGFCAATGIDPFIQLAKAHVNTGCRVSVNPGGFKARNTDVADEADVLLAFTFGRGAECLDGGTGDTVSKWLGRRKAQDAQRRIDGMNGRAGTSARELPAYHFSLTEHRLFAF